MLTFNFLPASSVFDLSFQFVMLLLLVSVCTQFHHLFFNRKFGASLSENGLNIQRACQKHEWKKEIVPVTQIMLAQAVTWPGHTLDRTGFDYQHSTHIFPFPKSSSRAFGSTQPPPPIKWLRGFFTDSMAIGVYSRQLSSIQCQLRVATTSVQSGISPPLASLSSFSV